MLNFGEVASGWPSGNWLEQSPDVTGGPRRSSKSIYTLQVGNNGNKLWLIHFPKEPLFFEPSKVAILLLPDPLTVLWHQFRWLV